MFSCKPALHNAQLHQYLTEHALLNVILLKFNTKKTVTATVISNHFSLNLKYGQHGLRPYFIIYAVEGTFVTVTDLRQAAQKSERSDFV